MKKVATLIVGSKFFGISTENSDTDLIELYLPDLRELLLGHTCVHKHISPSGKNTSTDTDVNIMTIQHVLMNGHNDILKIAPLFNASRSVQSIEHGEAFDWLIENRMSLINRDTVKTRAKKAMQFVKYNKNIDAKLHQLEMVIDVLSKANSARPLTDILHLMPVDNTYTEIVQVVNNNQALSNFYVVCGKKYDVKMKVGDILKSVNTAYYNIKYSNNTASIKYLLLATQSYLDIVKTGQINLDFEFADRIPISKSDIDYALSLIEEKSIELLQCIKDFSGGYNLVQNENLTVECHDRFVLQR